MKKRLIGKDPDPGRDWGQEERGTTEDEMTGWYHRLNGHAFEQTLGASGGQRRLVRYSPWSREESDMTEQLNKNRLIEGVHFLHITGSLTKSTSK